MTAPALGCPGCYHVRCYHVGSYPSLANSLPYLPISGCQQGINATRGMNLIVVCFQKCVNVEGQFDAFFPIRYVLILMY